MLPIRNLEKKIMDADLKKSEINYEHQLSQNAMILLIFMSKLVYKIFCVACYVTFKTIYEYLVHLFVRRILLLHRGVS